MKKYKDKKKLKEIFNEPAKTNTERIEKLEALIELLLNEVNKIKRK